MGLERKSAPIGQNQTFNDLNPCINHAWNHCATLPAIQLANSYFAEFTVILRHIHAIILWHCAINARSLKGWTVKETPWRRISVTSSLKEISMDHWKIEWWWGGSRHSAFPYPFLQQSSGQIIKDDVNGFPSPRIFASWLLPKKILEKERRLFCRYCSWMWPVILLWRQSWFPD